MRRYLSTSFVLSSVLLLPLGASCSADAKKHTPIDPKVTEFVQSLCDAAYRCCSPGEVGYYLGLFVNKTNCAELLMDATAKAPAISFTGNDVAGGQANGPLNDLTVMVPNLGALDRAVRDRRTAIDAEALAACMEFLGTVECNLPPEEPPTGRIKCVAPGPPPEKGPCDPRKIFKGQLGPGEPCTSDGASFECAPTLMCARNSALGETGQCVPAGQLGDPCLFEIGCDEDLYCSMLDGTCQKPRVEGESCVYADHLDPSPSDETLLVRCRADLSCDPITDTCVARCQQGASCSNDAQCDDEQELRCITGRCDLPRRIDLPCLIDEDCEENLRCATDPADPTMSICQERSPNGTACGLHFECQSGFCSQITGQCAPQVSPGQPCPSRLNEECQDGYCEAPFVSCTLDSNCPSVTTCDVLTGQCRPYCVAKSRDGDTCTSDSLCVSDACIAGICRTPPLVLDQACTEDDQCESGFCGREMERVCTQLPLPTGAACGSNVQCESLLCVVVGTGIGVVPTCFEGLEADQLCGEDKQPCNPREVFCDEEKDPPVCTPVLETGDICKRDEQCRSGSCSVNKGRLVCSPAAKPDEAICDGLL